MIPFLHSPYPIIIGIEHLRFRMIVITAGRTTSLQIGERSMKSP